MSTRAVPKVSIILPIFNGAEFLEETMRSLLNQTFGDFELLILDDGSTDSSLEIATSFEDARVKVAGGEHAGLTASLNRLLDVARGELIARADADDLYAPDRIEKQAALLERNQGVGVVGCWYEIINEKSETIDSIRLPVGNREMTRMLRLGPPFAHPAVMCRASLILQAGGYRSEFGVAQDYDLWARLSKITEFANVADSLFKYRRHRRSVSETKTVDQANAGRGIRAVVWGRLPKEPFAPEKWKAELDESLAEERRQIRNDRGPEDQIELGFLNRRFHEANLAYGAGRPDIGFRCLFEMKCLSAKSRMTASYLAAKAMGFHSAWGMIRGLRSGLFESWRRMNPMFEW